MTADGSSNGSSDECRVKCHRRCRHCRYSHLRQWLICRGSLFRRKRGLTFPACPALDYLLKPASQEKINHCMNFIFSRFNDANFICQQRTFAHQFVLFKNCPIMVYKPMFLAFRLSNLMVRPRISFYSSAKVGGIAIFFYCNSVRTCSFYIYSSICSYN